MRTDPPQDDTQGAPEAVLQLPLPTLSALPSAPPVEVSTTNLQDRVRAMIQRGLHLSLSAEGVIWAGPRLLLTEEDRLFLRQHRDAIAAVLPPILAQKAPYLSSCSSVLGIDKIDKYGGKGAAPSAPPRPRPAARPSGVGQPCPGRCGRRTPRGDLCGRCSQRLARAELATAAGRGYRRARGSQCPHCGQAVKEPDPTVVVMEYSCPTCQTVWQHDYRRGGFCWTEVHTDRIPTRPLADPDDKPC